jgi:thioester reductase-like protein
MLRELLLTGSTGVLGCELVTVLLGDPDTRLWLLLRAESAAALDQRVREVVAYAERAGVDDVAGRVRVVRGDLRAPDLGLSPSDYAEVAAAITHVVHSAADVRFDRSLDDARRTAVHGLAQLIALLRACDRPVKLDCVSTVGVAGARSGLITEEPQPLGEHGFRNSYEQAKAEAELMLLDEMSRGIAATIHRPAMIVGHSSTGRIRTPQGFYFLVDYFLGLKADHVVPDCGHILLDTIPVDYVANAVDHATRCPALTGAILHLCTGPSAWSLADVTARARVLMRDRGRELPTVTALPLDRFMRHLAERSAAGSRFHAALAQFESYFSHYIAFDNRRAMQLLEPAGIVVPTVESYLDLVLTTYWAERRAAAGV